MKDESKMLSAPAEAGTVDATPSRSLYLQHVVHGAPGQIATDASRVHLATVKLASVELLLQLLARR